MDVLGKASLNENVFLFRTLIKFHVNEFVQFVTFSNEFRVDTITRLGIQLM